MAPLREEIKFSLLAVVHGRMLTVRGDTIREMVRNKGAAMQDAAFSAPRVHLTLELSWSAAAQLQFFGRTHRTNQVLPGPWWGACIIAACDVGALCVYGPRWCAESCSCCWASMAHTCP